MSAAAALLAAALAGPIAEPPAFKPVRSDEDYAYLRDVEDRRGLDALRYIPLGGDTYLGFGGETRLRVDAIDAPRYGLGGARADTFALSRLLLSGDLHLGKTVRVYGELGLHRDHGKRDKPSATDRDGPDAQVLFVDFTPAGGWRLRLGRQELQLNPTQRFVAVREAPNIRQSFDGARLTRVAGALKLDAFYLQPVVISTGAFDDTRNRTQRFYGLYASTRLSPHRSLDLYALGLERDAVRFGMVTGDERRTSLGARLSGTEGAVDYEAEGVVQGGRFAGRRIRAFAASVGGGYTLDQPWRPRLGLRVDAGSGDKDPTDGRLGTFNPMFPKGAYFNETGLFSWGNLAAARASFGVTPRKAFSLEASYTVRRLWTRHDAIYIQPLVPLAAGRDTQSRKAGDAMQLDAAWRATRNLRFQGQLARQGAGSTIRGLGGRPVHLAVIFAQFRF